MLVLCAVCCMLCAVRCVLCAVRCAVCDVCGILCAVCGVRCAVCGVRCAVCACVLCGSLTVILRVGVLHQIVVAPADPEHHQRDAQEETNHFVLEVHCEDQQPGDEVLHVASQVPRPKGGREGEGGGTPTEIKK